MQYYILGRCLLINDSIILYIYINFKNYIYVTFSILKTQKPWPECQKSHFKWETLLPWWKPNKQTKHRCKEKFPTSYYMKVVVIGMAGNTKVLNTTFLICRKSHFQNWSVMVILSKVNTSILVFKLDNLDHRCISHFLADHNPIMWFYDSRGLSIIKCDLQYRLICCTSWFSLKGDNASINSVSQQWV